MSVCLCVCVSVCLAGRKTGGLISPMAGWKTGGLTEDGCVALLQVVDFLQPPPASEVRGNMVRIKVPPAADDRPMMMMKGEAGRKR